MSTFREIFGSNTFAIPGYPGYYYRPMDGAVVSNKTNEKYRTGKALKIYTTVDGDKFIYALDSTNCRRKLTIARIKELLDSEIRRVREINENINYRIDYTGRNSAERQQIENYIRVKEQNSFANAYSPPINRCISIDAFGNVILPPAIVFFY